jgi:hypothetical protein
MIPDSLKVSFAGTIGFITQLTGLDLFFKCIIGLLTISYLLMKIYDWIFNKLDKRKDKE